LFGNRQNRHSGESVIPAKAGTQPSGVHSASLDPGFRRDDNVRAGMTQGRPDKL